MKKRSITITLEKAREWYNSGNKALKEATLQAFDEDDLIYDFNYITTFKRACFALCFNYSTMLSIAENIAKVSKASAAMFKLNIIRKALNLGKDLHFTRDPEDSYVYYPYNPFMTNSSTFYEDKISSGSMEVIGKIRNDGIFCNVLGGYVDVGIYTGLGCFVDDGCIGSASANVGFLGCASKEIAQHFGRYFGMLITEAKYGDLADFEIVEEKYKI